MSKRLEYYYDNLKKLKIGLDEPFKFNCVESVALTEMTYFSIQRIYSISQRRWNFSL